MINYGMFRHFWIFPSFSETNPIHFWVSHHFSSWFFSHDFPMIKKMENSTLRSDPSHPVFLSGSICVHKNDGNSHMYIIIYKYIYIYVAIYIHRCDYLHISFIISIFRRICKQNTYITHTCEIICPNCETICHHKHGLSQCMTPRGLTEWIRCVNQERSWLLGVTSGPGAHGERPWRGHGFLKSHGGSLKHDE